MSRDSYRTSSLAKYRSIKDQNHNRITKKDDWVEFAKYRSIKDQNQNRVHFQLSVFVLAKYRSIKDQNHPKAPASWSCVLPNIVLLRIKTVIVQNI